jgi:hypothetical protein
MNFDPAKPADGSEIDAGELRDQFTSLKDEIPAGAVVDDVQIIAPGSGGTPQATASVTLGGGVLHFSFGFSPGPPGEVTAQHLNDALATAVSQVINIMTAASSANTNGVGTLAITSGDFTVQTLIEKVNELILGLRR